jgi:hypothetical protein
VGLFSDTIWRNEITSPNGYKERDRQKRWRDSYKQGSDSRTSYTDVTTETETYKWFDEYIICMQLGKGQNANEQCACGKLQRLHVQIAAMKCRSETFS